MTHENRTRTHPHRQFRSHAQQTENGVEYWLACDPQHLLGYSDWRNFTAVISKARTACEVSNHAISDHFVDVTKMVDLACQAAIPSTGDN